MTELEHEHTPEAIAERLAEPARDSNLRDWVLGGIDGAITTFAIVAGVAGAGLANTIVIILGVANLIADGISMAAGNYSGVKAENDQYRKIRDMERREISVTPDGERAEVRHILAKKGFSGKDLDRVVETLTSDVERWIDFMAAEEFGMPKVRRSPRKAAVATFLAFVGCGAVPLTPYLLGLRNSFPIAAVATCLVFFGIGAVKSKWSMSRWWVSGGETLAVGAMAAGTAYAIGHFLERLVGQ